MAASLLVACQGSTDPQQSAAALGSLSSSYGFVGVPARNADLAGPLVLLIREKVTEAPDRGGPLPNLRRGHLLKGLSFEPENGLAC